MRIGFVCLLLFLTLINCQSEKDETQKHLINLKQSSTTSELFAENIISTSLYERDMAISPKMDEIIFTLGDYKQTKRALVYIKKINEQWTEPKILNISGIYQDIEPFFSHDGSELYFASNRPIFGDDSRKDYNIWYAERIDGIWSEPIPLDSTINTKQNEFFPSLSKTGNLYFTSTRKNGFGREDIFVSKFKDGTFLNPEPLPEEINSSLFEFNAFVSPNENYIIFSSFGRKDGFGGGDLYVSEKDENGNWKKAKNLGEKINSDKLDYCPFVDIKSKNFYFTSEKTSADNDSLKTVNDLKILANKIQNGFGNIYRIDFSELNISTE